MADFIATTPIFQNINITANMNTTDWMQDSVDYFPSFQGMARYYCRTIPLIHLGHVITFSIFALFGLIGNVTLLSVILRTSALRNTPNILLINITIADLLYMTIAAPFGILHELHPCWLFGSIACKLRHYLPLVSQGACVFSLVALSRERYNAIARGLESRISRSSRRTLIVVAVTWVLGFLIASPVFWVSKTKAFGLLCSYVGMDHTVSQVYMVSQFVMIYAMPLVYIGGNYILLARSLYTSSTLNLAQNQTSVSPIQARKRLALIVLVITFLFGILWLPYYLYFLWFVFSTEGYSPTNDFSNVRFYRHLYYYMSLANSCLNPWVVFVMSSAHRRSFISCFTWSKVTNKTNFRKITNRPLNGSSPSCTRTGTAMSKI